MLINTNSLIFSEEHNVIGSIVGVDVVGGQYELADKNEDFYNVNFEDAIELRNVGTYKGVGLYENDILENETGAKYILKLSQINDKYVDIFVLDGSREIYTGSSYPTSELEEKLGDKFRFIGNAFELEDEESKFDFNIKVVRGDDVLGKVVYHYACNDKEREVIDLIKVIYVGHHLLEEETYERESISYDDYSMLLESGILKEVSPYELQNYVMGYVPVSESPTVEEDDDETLEDDYTQWEIEGEDKEKLRKIFEDVHNRSEISEEESETVEEVVASSEPAPPKNDVCEDCGEFYEDCDCIW